MGLLKVKRNGPSANELGGSFTATGACLKQLLTALKKINYIYFFKENVLLLFFSVIPRQIHLKFLEQAYTLI